eukprot:1326156-Amorphochlora_amoeboformis.AAC.1
MGILWDREGLDLAAKGVDIPLHLKPRADETMQDRDILPPSLMICSSLSTWRGGLKDMGVFRGCNLQIPTTYGSASYSSSLEEQLKLVRHQQRLFISFMQTANQKFMAIDSGLKEAIAAAAESATQSATKAQAQMYSKPMEASNQYYDYDVRRSPPPPGGPSQHPESQPRSGNSSARRWQDASEYAQRVEREQKSAATHAKSKNFRAKSSRVEARSESKRGSGAAAGSEVGFGDMDYGYNQKFGDEEGDDDVDNHSDDLGGPYANQTYQEPAQVSPLHTAPGITVSVIYLPMHISSTQHT